MSSLRPDQFGKVDQVAFPRLPKSELVITNPVDVSGMTGGEDRDTRRWCLPMIRTPLRPLARILEARASGENPDAIERENLRIRHEQMRDKCSHARRRAFTDPLGDILLRVRRHWRAYGRVGLDGTERATRGGSG